MDDVAVMKKIGLRIDIDSIGDIKAIPHILEMLEGYDLKASFFVTMGPDKTGRNLKKFLGSPLDLLRARPTRYGLITLARGFFKPENTQDHIKELRGILGLGHEIGLHGYDHYRWMNTPMDKKEINEAIKRGISVFKHVFGQLPTSFASPGFRTYTDYLEILDRFNFIYSSDFISDRPFYPSIDAGMAKTLQIPITMRSPGELALEGMSDDAILHHFKEQIKGEEFFTFYIHPSYECVYKKELINKMLSICSGIKNNLTFQKIYGDFYYEDTPNL